MNIGIIKWFDSEKGFGVISTIENAVEIIQNDNVTSTEVSNEVFLHIKNWKDKNPVDTTRIIPVVFDTAFERNKISAKGCKYFSNTKENWSLLLSYLGDNEQIRIIERFSTREYNIIEYALKFLTNSFDDSVLLESLGERLEQISISDLMKSCETIFRVRKNTENEKLKQLLDDILLNHTKQIDVKEKIGLWKNKNIPIRALSNNEILDNAIEFNFEDLKAIKNQYEDEEIINLLILGKLNALRDTFSFDDFTKFEELLTLIDKDSFKNKVFKDLNDIAKAQFLEGFFNNLSTIGKIEDKWDLDKIEKEKKKLPSYIDSEILAEIKKAIEFYILENATIEGLVCACLNNYFSEPDSIIIKNKKDLTENTLSEIINSESIFSEDFKFNLLESLLDDSSKYSLVLELTSQINNPEVFEKLDNKIFIQAKEEDYFALWSQGLGKILPEKYLINYFDEQTSKYLEINAWINKEIIQKEKISDILFSKLIKNVKISDRIVFYTSKNIISSLITFDNSWVEKISALNNNFFNLLLWHFGHKTDLDFKTLKGKFIYFNPDDQVYIFKRLFYLKNIGDLDFTFEEIDEIVRADIDLYLTNEKFHNDFVLDISTHTLIEAIKSYKERKNFLFESDLILKDLKNNSKKKFRIESYFDKCPGRYIAEWNWKTNGKIKKVTFSNNPEEYYYSVEFEAAFEVEGQNYYGSYTYFEKNPLFEELKDDVKKIPGRRWNAEKKQWIIPSDSKKEVFEYAKNNKFFIDLGDRKHYDNNIHLVEFSRDEIPIGIRFCEGRKSNIEHDKLKREFWWCSNQPCFENVEVDHLSKEFMSKKEDDKKIWEYYSFLDILNILKINTDEQKTTPKDFIPNGHYYKFIGHINAFNRLLDRLYCQECNELLYPTETSHFALYRNVKFHCENEKCSEYNKIVYLNHCLNGECSNIIDSRVSQCCENGLYICDNCGTCCSNAMFSRRLKNLRLSSGYIHNELIENVKQEKGHLEKAEYYCYKCKGMMVEISTNIYKCNRCFVEYDFEKFKWLSKKWTMKYQRRKDYPTGNKNIKYDEPDDDIF